MEAPTEAEMDAAEKKALDVLFANMGVKELLALHERWDGDPGNGLFFAFTRRLAPLAPEEFSEPEPVGAKREYLDGENEAGGLYG